jgi:hypothetical protein
VRSTTALMEKSENAPTFAKDSDKEMAAIGNIINY